MLTQSESQSSAPSTCAVFSSSLQDLDSHIKKLRESASSGLAGKKPGGFRSRLRDRISKNKCRIVQLQKTIEKCEDDLYDINVLKKALLQSELVPLVTFVDHIKHATDDALLSLQRELAKKEKDLEYVVYDRHVIWLDRKFTEEESAYLKHYQHTADMFKTNFLDKEDARFKEEVKHSERLLNEGEELMQSCKQKIELKNQKLRELERTVQEKEDVLTAKITQINNINLQLQKESQGSTKKTHSYILTAQLKNLKEDIRRLRNEKLDYEANQQMLASEIDKLRRNIQNMDKRHQKDQTKVKALEDSISATHQVTSDLTKKSFVEESEVKLKSFLKREKDEKDKLLREVNSKKQAMQQFKSQRLTNTKTMRSTDWNQTEDRDSTYYSQTSNCKEERLSTKSDEESKVQLNTDSEIGKPNELSYISFDPDWEFTQSEARLPIGLQIEISSSTPKESLLHACKPFASSSYNRSVQENSRYDSESSENHYWSNNKILEETDEESASNATPRLNEHVDQKANSNQDEHSQLYKNLKSEGSPNKALYESKATFETEESSEYKFDTDSQSQDNENKEKDNLLSLSIISMGEISNDERFVSPTASVLSVVPHLNLSLVKKFGDNSMLNSSNFSSTNYSSSGSKIGEPEKKRFSLKTTIKKTIESNGESSSHLKNKLSQDKPNDSKGLTKGLISQKSHYFQTFLNKARTNSTELTQKTWKDSKLEGNRAFSGGHWDFSKKDCVTKQKPRHAQDFPSSH